AVAEVDVGRTDLCCRSARLREHLGSHVYPDHASVGSRHPRRDQAVDAAAAPDIDNVRTGGDRCLRERITGARKGLDAGLWNVLEPRVRIAEQSSKRPSGMEVEAVRRMIRHLRILLAD